MSVGTKETNVYASVARTATPTAVNVATQGRSCLHLIIDVTATTSTPSVVPTIDALDNLSGKYYNLLTGVAITATGTTVLKIGRGIGQLTNIAAADMLPGTFRVTMTHADANSMTYTVNAILGA
jgi:hypothetical protein